MYSRYGSHLLRIWLGQTDFYQASHLSFFHLLGVAFFIVTQKTVSVFQEGVCGVERALASLAIWGNHRVNDRMSIYKSFLLQQDKERGAETGPATPARMLTTLVWSIKGSVYFPAMRAW